MNLINNRYRVINKIKQTNLVSIYLVSDILNEYQSLKLYLLHSECVPEKLLDFYTKEFIVLSNIDNPRMTRDLGFGPVHFIDNKKLDELEYYYTAEYIEYNCNTTELIANLNENKIIEFFIEVCKSVYYLHLKGFVYGSFTINNLFIHQNDEGEYRIKVKDFATVELEKYEYWENKREDLNFEAPEVLEGKKVSIQSDLYSLGVFLWLLCKKEISGTFNLQNEIRQCMEENGEKEGAISKCYPIIKKMTEVDIKDRYNSIDEVIRDINVIFHTEYRAYAIEELQKLNFNTKLVGREAEIDTIACAYNSMLQGNADNKFGLLHGEAGIGKTKLLKEIEHVFTMKGHRVYTSFALENTSKNTNKIFMEIVRKLVIEADAEILERYEDELVKLIPEMGYKKVIVPSEPLIGQKERFRLFDRIVSFMNDCIKKKPSLFLIDNLHFGDEFSIELIEYIYMRNLKNKNMMIVFSYDDREYQKNRRFCDFILKLNRNADIDIQLNGVSSMETAEIIQNILMLPYLPTKLGERIYGDTYGNPLFIEEVIKDLAIKKLIYIKEETGEWFRDYEYEDFPIPSTVEQAVLNQIKELEEEQYKILKIFSIFNTPVSTETINEFILSDATVTKNKIKDMVERGVLSEKIEDRGFVFDFYNKVLKNLIYNRLSTDEKKEGHIAAAQLLEKQHSNTIENKEELIYHLEKAGQKAKVIKYCLENAHEMKLFRNRQDEIKNLDKVISILDDVTEENLKIELVIRVGEIYEENGNVAIAIKYFKRAERLASSLEQYKYQVDALSHIGDIYLKRNDIKKMQLYLQKTESVLKKISYLEGVFNCKKIEGEILLSRQEYESIEKMCNEYIPLCGEESPKAKGFFYNLLGTSCMETSRIKEAIYNYKEAEKNFKKAKYTRGVLIALNNIGVIHGECYQDDAASIVYFKQMQQISKNNSLLNSEIIALVNLALSYLYTWEYKSCYLYFKEALEKSKRIEEERAVFYCYNYLSNVSLRLNEYKEAYEFYLLAEEEVQKCPERGKDIGAYYQIAGELFYELGDIDRAHKLAQKTVAVYSKDQSRQRIDSLYLLLKTELLIDANNLEENIEKIKILAKECKNISSKADMLYETCIYLYEEGKIELATKLFQDCDTIKTNSIHPRIQAKKFFLKGLISTNNKVKYFNCALGLSKEQGEKNLTWKICSEMGDDYFSENDYFSSVNFYFDACEIIRDLLQEVPEELKTSFIKNHKMFNSLNKLMKIKNSNQYDNILHRTINSEHVDWTQKEVVELFQYENYKDILKNKYFINASKQVYNLGMSTKIKEVKDVLKNLQGNPVKNLEIVVKYLESITLATRGMVILQEKNQEFHCIVSSNEDVKMLPNKYVLERVRASKKEIVLSKDILSSEDGEISLLPRGIKALICIPIRVSVEYNEKQAKELRKRNVEQNNPIMGYLYLESERILNNFNEESLEKCLELVSLTAILVDQYRLKITSSIDKLTGAFTRRFLEDALEEQVGRASEENSVFSIIMFDLDDFKNVNDHYGHQTGDTVLTQICAIVMSNIRKEDFCCRYGGEEFMIILPDTNGGEAILVAEKVRSKIEESKILEGKRSVTVSMGIASCPEQGKWKQELIEKADQALYKAKEMGKNRCEIWNDNISSKAKGANKLSGIVSGNTVQDYRNVQVMVELMELIKSHEVVSNKIYSLLGRIIEIMEAENGMIFVMNEEYAIIDKYGRKNYMEGWIEVGEFNEDVVRTVAIKEQGIYRIDWDEITECDVITRVPDWHSIIVVPLIFGGKIKGILYLSASTKIKEFTLNDFNFINTLGSLVATILQQ